MTEEEIEKQADDYVIKTVCKAVCPVCKIHSGCTIPRNDCNYTSNKLKGYIDGAKWGIEHAIEWHEIKCCSQDLPPRMKDNYLHSVIVSNEYGEPIYYDYSIDEWCNMEGDTVDDYKHWCELPTFKE